MPIHGLTPIAGGQDGRGALDADRHRHGPVQDPGKSADHIPCVLRVNAKDIMMMCSQVGVDDQRVVDREQGDLMSNNLSRSYP